MVGLGDQIVIEESQQDCLPVSGADLVGGGIVRPVVAHQDLPGRSIEGDNQEACRVVVDAASAAPAGRQHRERLRGGTVGRGTGPAPGSRAGGQEGDLLADRDRVVGANPVDDVDLRTELVDVLGGHVTQDRVEAGRATDAPIGIGAGAGQRQQRLAGGRTAASPCRRPADGRWQGWR